MMDVLTALFTGMDPVWQIAVVVFLACMAGSLLFLFSGRKEQVSEQEFEDFSPFFNQVKPVMQHNSDHADESDDSFIDATDWSLQDEGQAPSSLEDKDSLDAKEESRYPG